jgi:small membrane protein
MMAQLPNIVPNPPSTFQIVSVTVLTLLTVRDLFGLSRPAGGSTVRLVRSTVWVGTAVAILYPGITQEVAYLLGIGRGADVVLYVFVLAFLWTAFYLYSCHLRLKREVTSLVRQLAIQQAERQDPPISSRPEP